MRPSQADRQMSNNNQAASAKTVAEICQNIRLSKEAAKLPQDGMEAQAFLDLLIEQQYFADAVHVLAHSMPKREAIWWACLCSRPESAAAAPPPAAAAQEAAEAWVIDPTDEKRRAAHAAAEPAGIGTPVGLTCEAVFFSGGSIGPPDVAPVLPKEHLAATFAGNAVVLAAVADPKTIPTKYRQLLELGQQVASGENRWPEK